MVLLLALTTACFHLRPAAERNPAQAESATRVRFTPGFSAGDQLVFYRFSKNQLTLSRYDLSSRPGLLDLQSQLQALSKLAEQQKKNPLPEVRKQPEPLPVDLSSKGIRAALEEMTRLVGILVSTPLLTPESHDLKASLFEAATAIQNNFKNPFDTNYQIFELPVVATKYLSVHQAEKTRAPEKDSHVDPPPSSFWKPQELTGLDLYHGFHRTQKSSIENQICDYEKAKKGWGVHAGFHISCNGKSYKLKFGNETYSGPFNTRIYWALGYNVLSIDSVLSPKIRYQRSLLTEFNLRKFQNFKVKVGPLKVYELDRSGYQDPFAFMSTVRLKNGFFITPAQFKERLFKNPHLPKPELVAGNFIEIFEEQVDHILFQTASISEKKKIVEVGPWDYESLDHPLRRELRGLQILAAWVGNFDMRWENTRLVLEKTDDESDNQFRHYLMDVGSGLGKSTALKRTGSYINDMAWKVTSRQDMSTEFEETRYEVLIDGLLHIQPNTSFQKMTFEDGQWMVRRLARLSDEQILQALAGTPMSAAEARLAYEKLLSRRNQMIHDFELDQELSWALRKVNKKLDFTPSEAPLKLRLKDGNEYVFPSTHLVIRKGVVVPLN